jgi:hypothetical protein
VAENKTKPTRKSVSGFVAAIADAEKRADAKALIKLMQSTTGAKPKLWGPSIIGFGSHHYRYASGREGDMPLIGFSPRKPALVLYAMGVQGEKALLARLGKHKTGKGCLYIKRLVDVNMKVLALLAKKSVARRGK